MNERPILFSGEMVRSILDGKKTQTRRVMKPQPTKLNTGHWVWYHGDMVYWLPGQNELETKLLGIWDVCPYGFSGDRLWVRESFWVDDADGPAVFYAATDSRSDIPLKPSIFMPRKYSRITLEIVNVRVERVQDISESDAKAEGVAKNWIGENCPPEYENEFERYGTDFLEVPPCYSAKESYETLWDSINAKRGYGWDVNPWVWAVEFKVVQQ